MTQRMGLSVFGQRLGSIADLHRPLPTESGPSDRDARLFPAGLGRLENGLTKVRYLPITGIKEQWNCLSQMWALVRCQTV